MLQTFKNCTEKDTLAPVVNKLQSVRFLTNEQTKLEKVVAVFNHQFGHAFNTLLVPGADEPEYLASKDGSTATIRSRADYLSSALHEVAHWCIAGERRRQLDDFGYWYQADGRSADQQSAFEQVEVKPQALERCLAEACRHTFQLSADNLGANQKPSAQFAAAVDQQYQQYVAQGLPKRAAQFRDALLKAFENA